MPVYILEGSSSAMLPAGTLTVSLSATDASGAVRLTSVQDGHDTSPVISPRPGLLVLPSLRAATVIRVVQEGAGGVFSEGTVVSISLSTARADDQDAELAVLSHVDVSGLSLKDLVSVTPGPSGVVVAALDATSEDVLGPLASSARATARALLGVARVEADDAVDMLFGLDTSASMSTCVADGSVAAALDVLTGVSQVVAPRRSVRVALLGERPTLLPETAAGELSTEAVAALRAAPLSSGFRAQLPRWSGDAPAVTYVLTDGPFTPVPFTPAEASPQDPGRQHAVVLAPASAWSVLSRSVLPGPDGAVSLVPVAGDRGDEPYAVSDPQVLRPLVQSLLKSCFPAGTALAERLVS